MELNQKIPNWDLSPIFEETRRIQREAYVNSLF